MATVLLSPNAKQKFDKLDGTPANGYKLHTYAAGTTTPQATYSNRAGTAANTNPIILDARGEATVYLTPGLVYDYKLTSAADVLEWTQAGVTADAGAADAVGYQSDKANSVATSVERKLRNLDLDWEDFGIVADGVTDDSLSLERALNAANGRRLILPHGTAASPKVIKVTRPLVLTSGIAPQIIGGSSDKTIIRLVAATLASDVITFVGAPRGIKILGVGFDQNGVATTTTCGMLGIQNAEDLEIAYCNFLGFDKIGLALNGCRYFNVHHNRIARTTAATTYNQAFLLSSSSQPAKYGEFSHNVCVKSATDFDGEHLEISHNDISGWNFGAGVTIEQSVNSAHNTITDNKLYDSGMAADSNGYRPGGIENWGAYSTIRGNLCYSNSGAGIDQGGKYCVVIGNTCFNNGKSGVSGGDGIVSRYGDATYNASYSSYIGNTCFDAQGAKTQGYGYADQSASLTAITHRGNKYGAHLAGTENILASNTDRDSPVLEASYTTDPISLANGAQAAYAQTFSGAAVGDFVMVSFSNALQGIALTGHVNAANSVWYVFDNNAGGTIDLASGTVRVRVIKSSGYAAMF